MQKEIKNIYNIVVVSPNDGGGDTAATTSNQIFKNTKYPAGLISSGVFY